ncbi:Uncharacterized protein HZ326_27335 [Fusarium oxysporum f. sp. albedinis]|nr:Uncharacterized protein HZ326_27335 [Fusarium oxysporum f. sp. albedinis]
MRRILPGGINSFIHSYQTIPITALAPAIFSTVVHALGSAVGAEWERWIPSDSKKRCFGSKTHLDAIHEHEGLKKFRASMQLWLQTISLIMLSSSVATNINNNVRDKRVLQTSECYSILYN